MYKRLYFNAILKRLEEPRRFIQVISGPRQAGKTFLIRQVLDAVKLPWHYALADEPTLRDRIWVEQQWDIGRHLAATGQGAILVLDEVQKIGGWSEIVKRLWDGDTAARLALKVVLLGSSPPLVQQGLTESLAGRFEIVRMPHWSYAEMRDAFAWDLDRYLYFGGYPGAASLVGEEERWRRYITDALIETTISKDILLMKRVDKPALLRRLFHLGCEYSGQILSYQKMLGQLQEAGNTTTLAHYLELLSGAWMLCGLEKFSGQSVRRRGSSPKLMVFNSALMTASSGASFDEARRDGERWGRLVESAVGAHLINALAGTGATVCYWREREREVDFVVARGKDAVAIEVKSGRRRDALPGMSAFARAFSPKRTLLVGGDGIPLEEFLSAPPDKWL